MLGENLPRHHNCNHDFGPTARWHLYKTAPLQACHGYHTAVNRSSVSVQMPEAAGGTLQHCLQPKHSMLWLMQCSQHGLQYSEWSQKQDTDCRACDAEQSVQKHLNFDYLRSGVRGRVHTNDHHVSQPSCCSTCLALPFCCASIAPNVRLCAAAMARCCESLGCRPRRATPSRTCTTSSASNLL